MAQARGIVLASHDDATEDHVAEAVTHGVTLAEFPTTRQAAAASHAAGLKVLMGAPNIVRGGSHSGNIAAGDLVEAGLLDVLSSDYFPFSLIHATFIVGLAEGGIGLPAAVAMVTPTRRRVAGLVRSRDDRRTQARRPRAGPRPRSCAGRARSVARGRARRVSAVASAPRRGAGR